ncbi:MAG: DUF402 domain-containing protein [Mycoplasmataceae bacterium]|nr:DUF402 domain-containing protein [Mycoplasmataceae bacterium]
MAQKRKVSVHAYKFNGLLYRSWEFPTILSKDSKTLCVNLLHARVLFYKIKEGRHVYSKINTPTIWYFFDKEWYNIIVSIRYKKCYMYINVASPYIIEEDTIKFIDLDVDYKTTDMESKVWKELDMDELEEHSKLFNYPDNLKEKILQVAQDLKEKTAAGYFDKFYDLNLLTNGK